MTSTATVEHSEDLRGVFYVYLRGDIPPRGVAMTKRVMVNVDYDADGNPIGIEYGV